MQACAYNSARTLQVGPLHDSMACRHRSLCWPGHGRSEFCSAGWGIRTPFMPGAARATPNRWHRVSSPTSSSPSSSNRKTSAGRAGRNTEAKQQKHVLCKTKYSNCDPTVLRNGQFLNMLPRSGTPLPPNRRNSCTACTSVDERTHRNILTSHPVHKGPPSTTPHLASRSLPDRVASAAQTLQHNAGLGPSLQTRALQRRQLSHEQPPRANRTISFGGWTRAFHRKPTGSMTFHCGAGSSSW